MAKNLKLKPIAAALGTTFAVTLAASPLANAAQNPATGARAVKD